MKMLVVDAMVGIAVDELYMDELLVYINMLEIRITWWYHCQGGGGHKVGFPPFSLCYKHRRQSHSLCYMSNKIKQRNC